MLFAEIGERRGLCFTRNEFQWKDEERTIMFLIALLLLPFLVLAALVKKV